jgi:uncharacterized protein
MNAPNALSQDKVAADRKAYEPSMEEILASIRRIIADDHTAPPQPVVEPLIPVPPSEVAPEPPVVVEAPAELTPGYEAERVESWTDIPAAPRVAPAEPAAPLRSGFDFVPGREYRPFSPRAPLAERAAFSREAAPRPASEPPVERREHGRRLAPGPRPAPPAPVAPPVPAATVAAEEALVSPATDAMVSQAFNTLIASRFLQSNDVLGEMVRDMLKPMLKAWLDDNLPILVERLVRAEIERVARGGR